MAIGPTIIGPTKGLRLEVYAPDQAVYSVYGEKLWMFTAGSVTTPDQGIPKALFSLQFTDEMVRGYWTTVIGVMSQMGCFDVMKEWNREALHDVVAAYRQRVREAEEAAKKPAAVDKSAVTAPPATPDSQVRRRPQANPAASKSARGRRVR